MARVRVRQHVNPLSQKYQNAIAPPDWHQIYANPSEPLHLDLGCGRGKFLLKMAPLYPQRNFLGIEIRQPLVREANSQRDFFELTNLDFLFCNINISLDCLLKSLPTQTLDLVTIQFPDPWFKRRHSKRRLVQPELVATLAQYLSDGGRVFLQSDLELIAQEMENYFQEYPGFKKQHQENWLANNPLAVPTEREIATLARGNPVYRTLFEYQR